MIDIYLIIFLFFILFPIGIGFILYFFIKKYGNKKYAHFFAVIYSLIFLFIAVKIVFEDQLFSKNDAKKLVEEQEIILNDDFNLLSNRTETAIGDYYHTFQLEISEKDKNLAILKIKNSRNFKLIGDTIIDYIHSSAANSFQGEKQIQNYETENGFIREYFQPNGEDYAPTFRRIIIDKEYNKLTFEDIDE